MLYRWVVAAWFAAAFIACRPEAQETSTGVRDDAGRIISLAAPPRRIVSLSPATTELLFDLGAGDRLVGRTRWCQDPPAALEVPNVGDGFQPNVEAVLAQRPDLVVIYHSASNQEAVTRFEALGIATVSLRTDLLSDFNRAARILGRLLDRRVRADSLVNALEAQLSIAPAGPAASGPTPLSQTPPSIAIIAWDNPPIVIGRTSFLSELVSLAGASNAFADMSQPSVTVSIETIAARNPDFLLHTGDAAMPGFASRPEWRAVAAVRERRFVRVRGTEFGHPSFRAPQAVNQLREALARAVR